MPPRPGSIRSSTIRSKLSRERASLALHSVERRLHGEALRLEPACYEVDDPRLVLDQENRESSTMHAPADPARSPSERPPLGGSDSAVTVMP